MSRALWDQLRDYNRRDFHPDDRDTNALVENWQRELFGEYGTLNDKLATAGAGRA
jgi:predicted metal-dependent hydrolase